MPNEIFSDLSAQRDNFLTRIDARIKMPFVFGATVITIFSQAPHLPAMVAFLSLASLLFVGISPKVILFRLAAPLGMAVAMLLIQLFFYGETPLFKLGLFGFCLVGYREGLFRGLLITTRAAGCISLVIFLSMTTPANKLLGAARWFKVSKTLVEIATVAYRYVFVLLEDAIAIRDAQRVRLGYSNLSRSVRSLAELVGTVFIRAYDRSISTYEAMRVRGYLGTAKVFLEERFRPKDGLHLIVFSIILSLLLALNLFWR